MGVGVQGEPSDSASLRGARAAEARALVFLGAAQRPMMVRPPPPPPPLFIVTVVMIMHATQW